MVKKRKKKQAEVPDPLALQPPPPAQRKSEQAPTASTGESRRAAQAEQEPTIIKEKIATAASKDDQPKHKPSPVIEEEMTPAASTEEMRQAVDRLSTKPEIKPLNFDEGTTVPLDLVQQNTMIVDNPVKQVASSYNALATGNMNRPQIDGSSPPGCEPIFQLASLDVFSSLRVGSLEAPPSFNELLSVLLAEERDDDEVRMFVQVNRDLLDYRFLYRLTAEKLLAQNTDDTERSDLLQGVLERVIPFCIEFDLLLYGNVQQAERRIVEVLGSGKVSAEKAKAAAGKEPQEIFAFWLVLKSAITAWEAKINSRKYAEQAKQQLEVLYPIESALEQDIVLMETGGIAPLQQLFALPNLAYQYDDELAEIENNRTRMDNQRARKVFDGMTTDPVQRLLLLRRLGCLAIQAQRQNYPNYNLFVTRVAALYDVIYRGSVQLIERPDIKCGTLEEELAADDLNNSTILQIYDETAPEAKPAAAVAKDILRIMREVHGEDALDGFE